MAPVSFSMYRPAFHVPAGCLDKMLVVPVVNLLAPWFDRMTIRISAVRQRTRIEGFSGIARAAGPRSAFMPGCFCSILPGLKTHDFRPGPLPPPAVNFSPSVALKLLKCGPLPADCARGVSAVWICREIPGIPVNPRLLQIKIRTKLVPSPGNSVDDTARAGSYEPK